MPNKNVYSNKHILPVYRVVSNKWSPFLNNLPPSILFSQAIFKIFNRTSVKYVVLCKVESQSDRESFKNFWENCLKERKFVKEGAIHFLPPCRPGWKHMWQLCLSFFQMTKGQTDFSREILQRHFVEIIT